MNARWESTTARLRSHFFRAWTALAVLIGYIYAWVYIPEALTWWKRSTEAAIEAGCGLLSYPWGDRLEATIGNFGLWVQITVAILVFRVAVWLVLAGVRTVFSRRRPGKA